MYQVTDNRHFYLWKINEEGEWDLLDSYENLQNLFFGEATRMNGILDSYNFTGKDTGVYFSSNILNQPRRFEYLLAYRITDQNGSVLNPFLYLEEIREAIAAYESWRKDRYAIVFLRTRGIPFRFRFDPVPYCGMRFHLSLRREKCWFHNYRMDHIPEYEEYVRNKAKVPDIWDSEPFEPCSRSWKKAGKYRHQWEKHLH